IYVSGVISGTGDVSAYAQEYDGHTSTVEFDGTPGNSFTGTLYVSTIGNGQIVFNKSSGVVVVNRIGVRPTDIYNLPQTANLNIVAQNQIDPNATLMVYDGCQLHLMGLNSTVGYLVLTNFSENTNASVIDTGGTTLGLNDGIVAWNDSASVIPAVKGTLNLNGPLSFNIGGSQYAGLELPSKMGSAGGFTKTGSAALLLETNNTFSGNVTVSQGIVDVRNSNALGDTSGSTSLTGGSLTLRNISVAGETLTSVVADSLLFSIGTCTWSGPITLTSNLV